MIFEKIRWKNLFSYGKAWTEMDLNSNKTVNIIGSNGAGKSVFVEAVFLALTGKPLRRCKKDQIVNLTNKKNCLVELTVRAGKHKFLIERGAKPNVFKIYKDGSKEPIDEASMMLDTQTYLEMVLGFSKKNLKHTLIMSTTNYTPFLRLPAAEKRLFIEDILAIEIFSVMNKLVKSKLSILKDDIRDNQTDIEKLQYKLNMILEYNKQQRETNDEEVAEQRQNIITEKSSLSNEIKSIKLRAGNEIKTEKASLVTNIEKAKAKAKENIVTEKQTLKNDIESLKVKAKECKQVLADLKEKSALLTSLVSDAKGFHEKKGAEKSVIFDEMVIHKLKYEADLEKHRIGLDKGSKARFKVSYKLTEKEEDLEYFNKTAECTECKQKIDEFYKQKQMDDIGAAIADLQAKHTKIEKEIEKVIAFKGRIDKYKLDEITPLDEKCKVLESKMSDLKMGWIANENEIKVASTKQNACKRQMVEFKETRDKAKAKAAARIVGYENVDTGQMEADSKGRIAASKTDTKENIKRTEDNAKRRITGYETKITELESEERGNLKNEDVPLQDVEYAESDKKILAFKKIVHDTTIKILSDKGIKTYIIKRYIPKLNKLVNQYLDILSASYKLSFNAELEETIALKGYDKLSYNNFSEGERQRADIALLFAFLDIGKLKNSVTSNLLIMDEIFDRSLDDEGIRGIIDIIDSMKQKRFTVVNISHKHQLADKFDITYRAIKDRFSKLELLGNVYPSSQRGSGNFNHFNG